MRKCRIPCTTEHDKKMVHIYGIKQCSSMKKAFDWLTGKGIAYTFHDYKKEGVAPQELGRWIDAVGWQALLNTKGTTWRKLPEASRGGIDRNSATALMLDNPSIIKRPVIASGNALILGFSETQYESTLGTKA